MRVGALLRSVGPAADALSRLAASPDSVQTPTGGRPPCDAGEHVRDSRSVFEQLVQLGISFRTEV